MKGLFLGAGLGAVVIFAWGFLFWGLTPAGNAGFSEMTNPSVMQGMLNAAIDESGVYRIPHADDPSSAEYQRQHTEGPIATIYIRKEGSEPMAPSTFLMGYVQEFIVLLVMGLALKIASIGSFGARVMVVFLAGFAGSLFSQLAGPIWWLQPWDLAVLSVLYEAFAWLFGGLVLAFFISSGNRRDSSEV